MTYLKLINNLARAEMAYQRYKTVPNYHHAMHIYHANKVIYEELNVILSQTLRTSPVKELIINFMFRLEDWFLQFEQLEKQTHHLEQEFIFQPLSNAVTYPKDFIEKLTLLGNL
mgnify:FL=1